MRIDSGSGAAGFFELVDDLACLFDGSRGFAVDLEPAVAGGDFDAGAGFELLEPGEVVADERMEELRGFEFEGGRRHLGPRFIGLSAPISSFDNLRLAGSGLPCRSARAAG